MVLPLSRSPNTTPTLHNPTIVVQIKCSGTKVRRTRGWVTYCQNLQSMTYHDLGANSELNVIGQSIPMVAKCPIPKMSRWHLSLNKKRNRLKLQIPRGKQEKPDVYDTCALHRLYPRLPRSQLQVPLDANAQLRSLPNEKMWTVPVDLPLRLLWLRLVVEATVEVIHAIVCRREASSNLMLTLIRSCILVGRLNESRRLHLGSWIRKVGLRRLEVENADVHMQ